jgi:hypothetical protein
LSWLDDHSQLALRVTAHHLRAFELFCDVGDRRSQAEALNNLGQLATRTADTGQAVDRYTRALAIARGIDAPLRKRALEDLGQATSTAAIPAKAARKSSWPSRFTSASERQPHSESRNPRTNGALKAQLPADTWAGPTRLARGGGLHLVSGPALRQLHGSSQKRDTARSAQIKLSML